MNKRFNMKKRLISSIIFTSILIISLMYNQDKVKAFLLEPTVDYSTYVQNIGWQPEVTENSISGTVGKSLQAQGMKIRVENAPSGGQIQYSGYIQGIGWSSTVSDGTVIGQPGKLRMEAVKISLKGFPSNYHVEYKTQIEGIGWTEWSADGAISGTTGKSLRLESIRIKIVNTNTSVSVDYSAHSQLVGWMSDVTNGVISGTTGKGLRLEALKIKLLNSSTTMGITYSGYVKGKGWTSASNYGQIGTTGEGRQIESIKVSLTNQLPGYHVEYSTHIQNVGWTPYVVDGSYSGIAGSGKRIEAIRIKVYNDGTSSSTTSVVVPAGGNIKYTNVSYSLSQFATAESATGTAVNVATNSKATYNQIYDSLNINNLKTLQKTGQFMRLDKYYNTITVASLNNYLVDKGIFVGQGQAFVDAAKKHNINVLGIVAHAMWETGYGKSKLSQGILVSNVAGKAVTPKKVYNFFGIGAIDSSAVLSGSEQAYNAGWTSPAGAISGGAGWIAKYYIQSTSTNMHQCTFYQMRWNYNVIWHQYATDINWATGISGIIKGIYPFCSNTNMDYYIPVYP